MRFLKLLDPYETAAGLVHAEQAANATELFPKLVADSPLNYWQAGDSVASTALRLLVGVCPTFDLANMRLLDLMCDKLRSTLPAGLHCDVCNLDDLSSWADASTHFPGISTMVPNPIVGIWTFGKHVKNLHGFAATAYLLEVLHLGVTPEELARSVRPPSHELLGG